MRSLSAPDYVGPVNSTNGKVEFRINREHGRVTSVRFAVDNIRLACEDGRIETPDFNIRKAPFLNNHVFDVFFGREGSYYRIHGELLGEGRASGFIAFYDEVFDPPGDNTDETECSTDGGKQRWTAHEVSN
jgi:hypothetical protein